MTLLSVRDEIAEVYKATLNNVHVITHGGPLTVTDIEQIAAQSPAAIVSCLGIPRMFRQAATVSADAVFGVFCVVEDSQKSSRDAGALLLVESVMVELLNQRWNGEACGAPQDAVATNLYSTELDRCGVSLWAVRWRQQVDLDRNAITSIDDFETFFATYAVGPTDTPTTTDEVDLT